MLSRLSLRVRIFLFFCLLCGTAILLAGGALWFGWSREQLPASPFLTAFVLFVFLNTGVTMGVWLLFDENVAKPIQRLSSKLRLTAHTDVKEIASDDARYLGDLAPAAGALSQKFSASVLENAAEVARETAQLRAQSERLMALLSEVPVATILLNAQFEIVLYDRQAYAVLSHIALPRLRARIFDYFDAKGFEAAVAQIDKTTPEVTCTLQSTQGELEAEARIKRLSNNGYMVFMESHHSTAQADPGPLVFDFDLIDAPSSSRVMNHPLDRLCFVPFDTETTGLSVEKDDIVQLGAVRILNGKIIEGEIIDRFVNPGRPIPPASTRIHHVTDADVADAPTIAEVGKDFHRFAKDAVLVAHNAPFDIGLLRRDEAALGVRWDHPVVDTVLLSAILFGTNEDHTLDTLCSRFAIEIPAEDRHTALGDARATGAVLVQMIPILMDRGINTLGDLIGEARKHGRLLRDLNK